MSLERVVVVGASVAGFRTCEALRRMGYGGALSLIGEEFHGPYQRPPLSKQFLAGAMSESSLSLRSASDLGIQLMLGERAEAADLDARRIVTASGRDIPYDGLVIATGSRAIAPPWARDKERVLTLRTVDDSLRLRKLLGDACQTVAVIGAGFVGLEVAGTCRNLGKDVYLIDVSERPMENVLGEELSQVMLGLHRANGVSTMFGSSVLDVDETGAQCRVLLESGRTVEADVVIVSVGVRPATDWLEASGLVLKDGIVCDARCRAAGVDNIVAAGDVARWFHEQYDDHLRVEHWDNAVRQAQSAARGLLTGDDAATYRPVPFFWTEQFSTLLQFVGRSMPTDTLEVVDGALDSGRFAAHYKRGSTVVAVALGNSPRRLGEAAAMVRAGLGGAGA